MKDLFTIELNNKEYVHIDTIKYKTQILYHFGSLKDEIFCTKNGEQYVPINDDFQISIIKNKLGLINTKDIFSAKDEIRELINDVKFDFEFYLKEFENIVRCVESTTEVLGQEKDKIVNEQIENFAKAKEKFNLNINLDEIKQKIAKVKLIKKDQLHNGRVVGFYRSANNMIALEKENNIDSDNIYDKRTRFHEYIHAITGKKCHLYHAGMMRGFLEGETENLVEDFFGNNTSYYNLYERTDVINVMSRIQFNFSRNTSYKPQVSIIKQMEHALGKKSYNSILNGNMEFESEFAKKYGMPLMIFMAYRTRMLMAGKRINEWFYEKEPFDEVKYFRDTQNILMKKVFDKDFKHISNINDAKLYLQKLRDFEIVRGRISRKTPYDNKYIEDTSFQQYYDEKHKNIIELLHNKGMEKTEIESELEKYRYERQEFKPYRTKEEEKEFLKQIITEELTEQCIENKEMIDASQYDCKYFNFLPNCFSVNIVKKDTNDGYGFITTPSSEEEIVDKTFKDFFEPNEKIPEGGHELDKYIQYWKNKGYKEEKIEFSNGELEKRINNRLVILNEKILGEIYDEIFKNDTNQEKMKVLKERETIVKDLIYPERHNTKQTATKIPVEEGLDVMRTSLVAEVGEVGTAGPSKVETTGKIKKILGLISLSKAQDREIEDLEEKQLRKEGREFNE